MKQGKKLQTRFLCQAILAGLALAAWTGVSLAQQAGGAGGGGGGGANAGMATEGTALALGSGTVGTGTAKGGANTSPIQKTNFMAPYYSSGWNAGWGGNITLKSQAGLSFNSEGAASSSVMVTGRGIFGAPNVTPATAAAGGAKGGAAGGAKGAKGGVAGATTAMAATTSGGFNTVGKPRITAAFVTRLDPDMLRPTQAIAPVVPVAQIQNKVGNVIALSPTLQSNGRINVAIDTGNVVVLQGTVETERDKRHAENLIRTEPGVNFVRNELVITGAKK